MKRIGFSDVMDYNSEMGKRALSVLPNYRAD